MHNPSMKLADTRTPVPKCKTKMLAQSKIATYQLIDLMTTTAIAVAIVTEAVIATAVATAIVVGIGVDQTVLVVVVGSKAPIKAAKMSARRSVCALVIRPKERSAHPA